MCRRWCTRYILLHVSASCGVKTVRARARPRPYFGRTTVSGVFHPVKRQPNITRRTTAMKADSPGLPGFELSDVLLLPLSDILAAFCK